MIALSSPSAIRLNKCGLSGRCWSRIALIGDPLLHLFFSSVGSGCLTIPADTSSRVWVRRSDGSPPPSPTLCSVAIFLSQRLFFVYFFLQNFASSSKLSIHPCGFLCSSCTTWFDCGGRGLRGSGETATPMMGGWEGGKKADIAGRVEAPLPEEDAESSDCFVFASFGLPPPPSSQRSCVALSDDHP